MKTWVITEEQRDRLLEEARRSIDYNRVDDVMRQYAILRGRVQGCMENLVEMTEEEKDGHYSH